ncbi:E3 SUMO-protein ligase gei-17 [Diplonema papillatum]|nr:E3 SUMO-protein ligase gei-17 [Diplonema papillatum]
MARSRSPYRARRSTSHSRRDARIDTHARRDDRDRRGRRGAAGKEKETVVITDGSDAKKKALERVELRDACEAHIMSLATPFEVAVAIYRLGEVTLDSNEQNTNRQTVFLGLVDKAVEHFSHAMILDVLVYIDKYYLSIRSRFIDKPVHEYVMKIIDEPTPQGVKQLAKKILVGRTNRFDTVFSNTSAVTGAVLSRADTWTRYSPTLEEEVAKLTQWIDSQSSHIDLALATRRVQRLFVESIEDDSKDPEDVAQTESIKVDLHDPLSNTRIVVPACGKKSRHLQPFDLEHFLYVNVQRARTMAELGKESPPWKCPVSNDTLDKDSIIVDPFFSDILAKVPPEIRYVVVSKDGSWKEDAARCGGSSNQTGEQIVYTEVDNGPFDPAYDIVVKQEKRRY